MSKGKCEHKSGNSDLLRRALLVDRQSVAARYSLGILLVALQRQEEALACFTPVWTWFDTLPTYGKFAFTDDKVLLTFWPRPFSTKIATTAMRARISAYSTKLWPFRDFSPRYIFRRVLFISFTSFIWLFRIAQRSNRLTFIRENTVAAYVPPSPPGPHKVPPQCVVASASRYP